jgi:ubiquitin-protein ligase E3 C
LTQPAGTRALSSRQLASLSPRLGILNNIPFAIPFETRFRILRAFIEHDRAEHEAARAPSRHYGYMQHAQQATVRRGHIAQDGFDKLGEADLKEHVQIQFVDQFGEVECVATVARLKGFVLMVM